ncbi:MAG: hypothetical protein GXP29_12840 [Planctomycetes bacterium]|nr:hypothetical protein [Planctomycetota bacterium]
MQVNRELERSAGPSRESVVNKPEQIAGQVGAKAASKPDLQTATPATSQAIAVSTAGAARISSVGQAPSSATSAEKIGQLLGGKGQLQPTRAATPSVPVDSQQAASQKNSSQGRSTTARLEQPATSRSSATDVETTKRSEFENLVKNIRMNRGIKSSSATIRLNPPELGRLKIHAQMKDDALSVRVEAMSASTRSLISERSDELVAALRERGIDVERFEVIRLETEQGSASRDEDGSSTALDQRETDHEEGRQASERTNERAVEGPRATEATDREFVEDTVGQKAQLDVRI